MNVERGEEAPTAEHVELSKEGFSELLKNLQRKGDAGEYSERSDVPGFASKEVVCVWGVSQTPGDGFKGADVHLYDRGQEIAVMLFRGPKLDDGTSGWKLTHRLVKNSAIVRRKGLGSFTLRTAEALIRKLHAHDPRTPMRLEISTTRPTLVQFGVANGYAFEKPEEEAEMQKYLSELKDFGASDEYLEEGILPSFRELKVNYPGGYEQDRTLADRKKLEAYMQEQRDTQTFRKVVEDKDSGFLILDAKHNDMDSEFLVRFHLGKDLEAKA